MQSSIIISGFGGQGTLFAGQVLAYAAMDKGLEVTWIPSYGPEMRGGTANCTVIVSDQEIGSPMVGHPDAVIAMNLPSVDKYLDLVKPGGYLFVNTSMVNKDVTRDDIHVVELPANDVAEKLGDKKLSNMVMLGSLLGNLDLLPIEAVGKSLKEHLPAKHHKLLPANNKALEEGATYKAK